MWPARPGKWRTRRRVWTAPIQAFKGVSLPSSVFGVTEEGAAHRVGVMPVLDRTGITERIRDMPSVQRATESYQDWRRERAMKRDVSQNILLPSSAQQHLEATDLQRQLGPAGRVLHNVPGYEPNVLSYATHLLRTGMGGVLEQIPEFRDRVAEMRAQGVNIDETAVDRLVAETMGLEQGPSAQVIDTVLGYRNGTLDPEVAHRIELAGQFEGPAIAEIERQKLERGQLNPEQTGQVPMPSRVDAITGAIQDRIDTLNQELEGRTVGGEYQPGLRAKRAQAQAQVPEVDLPRLAGYRAQAAARRHGAVEQEAVLAGRQAEVAGRQAERAAEQAQRATDRTLAGRAVADGGAATAVRVRGPLPAGVDADPARDGTVRAGARSDGANRAHRPRERVPVGRADRPAARRGRHPRCRAGRASCRGGGGAGGGRRRAGRSGAGPYLHRSGATGG